MGVYESMVRQAWQREEPEAEAAREVLASHVPDEDSVCVICLVPGPCGPANAAANRLVDLGRPVLPTDPPRPRRSGWRGWLAPRRTRRSSSPPEETLPRRMPPRRALLLTYVWIVRLGATRTGGVTP
ncbi:hypothetical protein Vqi01_31240 [Micromonospora qiuiae]|uniref:Uncharacterized protein n=1 Tax=Micromonospora qiuiae TaxID=502268 RepID=A0ABQ4JCZ1_9ACTN|nr:hypothetical protein [Micromonospora qiuiae]GIJ27962.1 hypothetical protein Vqi01_31240 [Micromonospora qiuiae]